MPNVTLPNGRKHYVNPFSMLCDRCEDRTPSDWIGERCRYECPNCQRDWDSEHGIGEYADNDNAAHVAGTAIQEAAE